MHTVTWAKVTQEIFLVALTARDGGAQSEELTFHAQLGWSSSLHPGMEKFTLYGIWCKWKTYGPWGFEFSSVTHHDEWSWVMVENLISSPLLSYL